MDKQIRFCPLKDWRLYLSKWMLFKLQLYVKYFLIVTFHMNKLNDIFLSKIQQKYRNVFFIFFSQTDKQLYPADNKNRFSNYSLPHESIGKWPLIYQKFNKKQEIINTHKHHFFHSQMDKQPWQKYKKCFFFFFSQTDKQLYPADNMIFSNYNLPH